MNDLRGERSSTRRRARGAGVAPRDHVWTPIRCRPSFDGRQCESRDWRKDKRTRCDPCVYAGPEMMTVDDIVDEYYRIATWWEWLVHEWEAPTLASALDLAIERLA